MLFCAEAVIAAEHKSRSSAFFMSLEINVFQKRDECTCKLVACLNLLIVLQKFFGTDVLSPENDPSRYHCR
jgi:hypothetical protein